MTITISTSEESSKIEKLLKFLYKERITFDFVTTTPVTEEDLAIRERLRAKYVQSGAWENMSLDEKEDATLLESMLYDKEKDAEMLSPTEQAAFLKELRAQA